jgi:hypothetical protein
MPILEMPGIWFQGQKNKTETVTLRSQLDSRAQEDADKVYGFDEGHVAILSSPVVFRKYNEIVTSAAGTGKR